MSEQDLGAATGTLDTSETGGAHSGTAVVDSASIGLPEGRAFRPESETRDLVNAAYGVVDADPFPVDENEIPEGEIVSDQVIPTPEDEGAIPVIEGDPQPTDVTSDPEVLAEAAEAQAEPISEPVAEEVEPVVEPVSEAPATEGTLLAPGSEQGADAIQVNDPTDSVDSVQAASDALAAADAALAPAAEPQS
jgi:hypothetical protein